MSKLPDSFEKEYFDLLIPITTDGVLKNRRNLMVSSFIIVSIYFLDKSLSDLKVLGLSLEGANGNKILVLGLLLIVFWLIMYIAHLIKDSEINRERRHLLDVYVIDLRERLNSSKESFNHLKEDHPNKRAIIDLEKQYGIYTNQLDRTRRARIVAAVIEYIEKYLPIAMSIFSFYLIYKDI